MLEIVRTTVEKIFITGASGFVGRRLCRSLFDMGYFVRAGVRHVGKSVILPPQTEIFMIDDIGPRTDWEGALDGIDTIIHLASRVHVMKETSSNLLDVYRRVNTAGTERLVNMAVKVGVRYMIFLSTIKVNGEETTNDPFTEGDAANPHGPYAQSKWEAEQILHRISDETDIEVTIIRPPLVYGPSVGGNFLRMLHWINKGVPLPLANISNRRSLIYVGNLVDAIISCINHPNAAGETFLVSDGEDLSTPDLIRIIAREMNKNTSLVPFPVIFLKALGKIMGKKPEIDRLSDSLCVDSSKIRNVLGWKPPTTVEDGIRETVNWYVNRSRTVRC